MAKPTAQQVHALISYYISSYEKVVGKKPVVNRNKVRYWLESMLMDYTGEQARELIDHYLNHWEDPTIDWFAFNYEKVDVAKQEYERNKVSAAVRRKETKQKLEEWRNRWKK